MIKLLLLARKDLLSLLLNFDLLLGLYRLAWQPAVGHVLGAIAGARTPVGAAHNIGRVAMIQDLVGGQVVSMLEVMVVIEMMMMMMIDWICQRHVGRMWHHCRLGPHMEIVI